MSELVFFANAGLSEEAWRIFYVTIFVVGLLRELFRAPEEPG